MNVLLQGDVGSGKTLVALHACLAAIQSSHQAAIMAPTEVLAGQHARSVGALLEGVIGADLLAGAPAPARDRCWTGSMARRTTRRARPSPTRSSPRR